MRDHARAPVARDAKGHFLPGVSGNPDGRPKEERELRELARSFGPEAIQRIVHLMRNAEDERVQLGAAEALLTRGYGRPAEAASGPLVAIQVGAGATAAITDAHEAARVYRDLMSGAIDVGGVTFAQPALLAPVEAEVSAIPSPRGGGAKSDPRVEAVDTAGERRETWEELAK